MRKITEKEDNLIMEIFIKPNSKGSKLVIEDNAILLYIPAPPVKGKANKAIIQFLSAQFHIPKRQISIIAGSKSKTKTITFSDLSELQKTNIFHLMNK